MDTPKPHIAPWKFPPKPLPTKPLTENSRSLYNGFGSLDCSSRSGKTSESMRTVSSLALANLLRHSRINRMIQVIGSKAQSQAEPSRAGPRKLRPCRRGYVPSRSLSKPDEGDAGICKPQQNVRESLGLRGGGCRAKKQKFASKEVEKEHNGCSHNLGEHVPLGKEAFEAKVFGAKP